MEITKKQKILKTTFALTVTFIVVSLLTAGVVGDSNSVVTTTLETTTAPVEITTVEVSEVEVTEITTEPPTEYTTFKVTGYCACEQCCGKTDGITATGTKATQGRTIAVDPSVIPYGTKIILNGNTYVAEDCGGAIKGNRIDMFFDNHQDALEWGVRYVEGVVV